MFKSRFSATKWLVVMGVAALLGLTAGAGPIYAVTIPPEGVVIVFDTELTSLNLTGGPFAMPLASDPGNLLGDSVNGFGFVNSNVAITLSSQSGGPATLGQAVAQLLQFTGEFAATSIELPPEPTPLTPELINDLDGQSFFVDSFFDVFFDITVTDVDGRDGRNFAGMPNGASISLPNNGPANLQSFYSAIFDKNAPNFGLIPPPEVAPYIGHFTIEIPLGGDINGNGEDDKLKFTFATHSVGDENRTFIILPDGTVVDSFDSAAFLEGAVVDLSTDPPFTIGQINPLTGLPDPSVFGGPTSASSHLQNQVVPEPSSLILLGIGLLGILGYGWRKRKKAA
jgi:hypothetical protein